MTAPPRIALSIGAELRGWEAEAIAALREAQGIALLGWMEAPGAGARKAAGRLPAAVERSMAGHPLLAISGSKALDGLERIGTPQAEGCDIILHLGGAAPDALQGTKGMRHWCYRHGDGEPGSAFPPGIRESILGLPYARFRLVDCAEGMLLQECAVPLEGDPAADAAAIAALAARWPVQQLRAIRAHGETPAVPAEPFAKLPAVNWWALWRWRWRRLLGRQVPRGFDESGPWNIGVLY
ncbi:MAG: hypothetical protein ACK4L7_00665, partial [Flavobacteriales bacterium]